VKNKAFQFYLFFQSTDISTHFSWAFLFLDQKAHQLGAKANKHPFYLYLNSPESRDSSDTVQDLAGSLKPFPERLSYKTAVPP
jgi:hypothetical protein